MRLNHIVLLITLSAYGQSVVRKTVCASGCDYVNTYLGLNSAVSDAASYQGSSCVPYLIEIDTANPVDLLGNTIFLPAKTCAQYVRIRSMQIGSLPSDGTRLDPSTQSGYLARIQSTTTTPNSPMIIGPTGAYTRYWAFEGIDFYGNGVDPSAVNHYFGLLVYGSGAGTYPSSADRTLRPDHLNSVKYAPFRHLNSASDTRKVHLREPTASKRSKLRAFRRGDPEDIGSCLIVEMIVL